MGDPDRAPIGITFMHQAALHAGAEAAVGALIANNYRRSCGEGQHVDVSMQDTCIWILQATPEMYEMNGFIYRRAGGKWVTGSGLGRRQFYACKDGYVAFVVIGGGLVGMVKSTKAAVKWMEEDGMATDWLVKYDWEHNFDMSRVTQEEIDRVEAPFVEWFKTKKKGEIWAQAMKRGIMIAPLSDIRELLEDEHLKARNYWVKIPHPELNDTLTYPGNLNAFSKTPGRILRRAPLIGEHNEEVYLKDLGISREKLLILKQAAVI